MLQLSVIVATYNRCETLRRALTHLIEQTLSPDAYEIIVIDDASLDRTRDVVHEISRIAQCDVRYLTHPENRGPGFTQNQGIREARAPTLLLIADDILMSPGALAAHLTRHRQYADENTAILGDVVQAPDAQTSVFMRNFDPFRLSERAIGLPELPYYLFGACNMSLSTRFMLRHGMFLEHRGRAGAAAHEDMELGYRLCSRGLRIHFSSEARGYHYHIDTLESQAKRMYERGLNWDEFRTHMRDPEIVVVNHLLDWHTFGEYVAVLGRRNGLVGRERRIAWHMFRECIRRAMFNGVMIDRIWRHVLQRAEESQHLAALVHPSLYRAFLYHHFRRGVADAQSKFGRP